MGISKYNSEGYHHPTTYEALSKIEKEEKAAAVKGSTIAEAGQPSPKPTRSHRIGVSGRGRQSASGLLHKESG